MMRSILVTITFFTALFTLPGCSSFEAALRSLLSGPDIPVVEDIDYSYPVTGAVAEQGAIAFKLKPGFWEKLFHNPAPPVPANESEILVYLDFVSEFQWILSWGVPPERLSRIAIVWGDVKKYFGTCDILFESISREGRIVIRKESNDPGAKNVVTTIVLDIAVTETVSVEMNDDISPRDVLPHMPPYSWGELVLSGRAYRIFSVIEEAYYARYPDFSQKERETAWWSSRVETTAKNFLRNEQKFQILDNSDTVVAELCENNYTLYGTLPQTEWDNMKQALALFHAFRYIAQGLI